jgi:cell division GTPase FtsZ
MQPNEFYDTDGILFITSASGNLGSGSVPVLAQNLKERHIGKPIHAMVVLPFESERNKAQTIFNTAISLKSLHQTTDAIFLFENDRFKLRPDSSSIEASKKLIKAWSPISTIFCARPERREPDIAVSRRSASAT